MILNKSLLLYTNHFYSINKNTSNKECFYLNRETNYSKLLKLSKTKQWNC